MKNLIKITLALVITLISNPLKAQSSNTDDVLSLQSGTINSQFEYIFVKSGDFRGTKGQKYEAVKFNSLLKLKNNVLDSLKTIKTNLKNSESTVSNQTKEIESLKSELSNTNSKLAVTNEEKDNMSLFGLQMSKISYNILMWVIIAILFALLLLFIVRFKSSNSSTREAKNKLVEVEAEFENHRRIALEREQKVRRQLQDEINKNKS